MTVNSVWNSLNPLNSLHFRVFCAFGVANGELDLWCFAWTCIAIVNFWLKMVKCETSFPVAQFFLSFRSSFFCALCRRHSAKNSDEHHRYRMICMRIGQMTRQKPKTVRRESATFCSILVSYCEWINGYRQLQIVLCCTLWMDYWCPPRSAAAHNRLSTPHFTWGMDEIRFQKWEKKTREKCMMKRPSPRGYSYRELKCDDEVRFLCTYSRLSVRHSSHVALRAATLIAMRRNCVATSSISDARHHRCRRQLKQISGWIRCTN